MKVKIKENNFCNIMFVLLEYLGKIIIIMRIVTTTIVSLYR